MIKNQTWKWIQVFRMIKEDQYKYKLIEKELIKNYSEGFEIYLFSTNNINQLIQSGWFKIIINWILMY